MLARINPLSLRSAQLFTQLIDSDVESGELVAIGGFCTNNWSLADHGELDGIVCNSTVVVGPVRHLDIHSLCTRREVVDTNDLLLDDGPEPVGDAYAHADDVGFHL